MDGSAQASNREISFMEFLTGNNNDTAIQFLHYILNPASVNTVNILVAPHGEIDYAKMNPEQETRVKLSIANFAPPGTVNWSDNKVNKGILACFEKLSTTEEFIPYLPALTSGNPAELPQGTSLDLTLDEIFFAAMCRLLHCFEMADVNHPGPTLSSGPFPPRPDSLAATGRSYDLNFFTTKPTIIPRSVGGVQAQPRLMSDDEVMACMRMFRVNNIHGKLTAFNKYLQERDIRIILPSSIQFPKLFSLPKNEHTSHEPPKLTKVKLAPSTKAPEEKQYEHKIVAFIRSPDGLTDATFIQHIHNLLQSSGNIACYNRKAGPSNYQDLRSGVDTVVPTGVAGLFADQLLVDIHAQSKFWNKLCIIVETPAGRPGAGSRLGTLVQWRVETRMGGFKYLVFNIWNMISSKMNIVQTAQGQDNSTATTKDITDFVTTVLKLTPDGIACIVDATCHVPGGSDLRVQSSWVANSGPLDPGLSGVISKLAFSHADSIRLGKRRQRASSHDLLRDFVYGLDDKVNEVFTLCNDKKKDKEAVKHIILADPTYAKHADTSLPNISFRSVPEVLERLLDDDKFRETGVSSFGVSVIVDVLQHNEELITPFGINRMDTLKRFGICVCKYLHDTSNTVIVSMNTRGVVDEFAFEKFYDAVHFLKFDKHAFKVNNSGDDYQRDLMAQAMFKDVKYGLQPYHRADARVDSFIQSLPSRPTQSQLDQLANLRQRFKPHDTQKDKILGEVDVAASMMEPSTATNFMKTAYDIAGFVPDIRGPFHYEIKDASSIVKIQAVINEIYTYCDSRRDIGEQRPIIRARIGEGGKKTKTRRVKRNKSRNFRNKSRVRRTRRRVIKRKNNKK